MPKQQRSGVAVPLVRQVPAALLLCSLLALQSGALAQYLVTLLDRRAEEGEVRRARGSEAAPPARLLEPKHIAQEPLHHIIDLVLQQFG